MLMRLFYVFTFVFGMGPVLGQVVVEGDTLAELLAPEIPQTVISVASTPAGCWVQIDSIMAGQTPLHSFSVSAGNHVVRVFPPNNGVWDIQEHRTEIQINEGENRWIRVEFASPVLINSLPYGATLYQDTSIIGTTPLHISFDANEGNRFQIRKNGYHPFLFTLTERQAILAELEADASYAEANKKSQFLGLFPKERVKSKFTLLALTVVAQWGAFYLKNTADKNFDKYRESADPALQKKYWDNTQRYDRLSEITLGTSYVSLAGLIYLVVRH